MDYKKIADKLYDGFKADGSNTYHMEYIKSYFYGNMVKDHIPVFKKLHDYLVANNHTKDNALWQGDADNAIWYEKAPDEYTKVLVDSRVVSCADDYTHIFVLKDYSIDDEILDDAPKLNDWKDWIKFNCFTAFPRQKKSKYSNNWGDHRDIEDPSINTHRKSKFKFGYGDARDKFYSFAYDSMQGKVEDAYAVENRLMWALRTLTDGWEDVEREIEILEPSEDETNEYMTMADGMKG